MNLESLNRVYSDIWQQFIFVFLIETPLSVPKWHIRCGALQLHIKDDKLYYYEGERGGAKNIKIWCSIFINVIYPSYWMYSIDKWLDNNPVIWITHKIKQWGTNLNFSVLSFIKTSCSTSLPEINEIKWINEIKCSFYFWFLFFPFQGWHCCGFFVFCF